MSDRALGRATLARQHLLDRSQSPVEQVVNDVMVLQAQQPESVHIGLWNRMSGFTGSELDDALDQSSVVKARTVRMTLHLQTATDYPIFRPAMQTSYRSNGMNDRFDAAGLAPDEADALFAELDGFLREPRTSDEVRQWLADATTGECHPGLWRAFGFCAPVLHSPTDVPWRFSSKRTTFVRSGAPAEPYQPEQTDTALTTMVERYLRSFGPATAADAARFCMVHGHRTKAALTAMAAAGTAEVVQGSGSKALWDVPDGLRPDEDTPAPARLLPMFDNAIQPGDNRDRVIDKAHRLIVGRANGDLLPTLLVDGRVAGVWRVVGDCIEATPFARLPKAAWAELETEAVALLAFLATRETAIWMRHQHWWDKLPTDRRRIIAE